MGDTSIFIGAHQLPGNLFKWNMVGKLCMVVTGCGYYANWKTYYHPRLGAYEEQVVIHVRDGKIQEKKFFIHFHIQMTRAWDYVVHTCSNMLVLKDEARIDSWTRRHDIPKGTIQPIENVWDFSKKWYGNHFNPHWEKWTMQDAKDIFYNSISLIRFGR